MARDLVYGRHAVGALLERDPYGISEIWVQQGARHPVLAQAVEVAGRLGLALHHVPRRTLDRMLGDAVHQGVAVRHRSTSRTAPDMETIVSDAGAGLLLLVLDEVTDPHNVGACLRVADGAGANAVVVPRHRSGGLGAAARKVASGAAESVPLVQVGNLAQAMTGLASAGVTLVGADADASATLYECDFTGPLGLVLGSEDRGLRRLTRERCDRLARIPMGGTVGSLNVATAAAVFAFEARRQRLALKAAGR